MKLKLFLSTLIAAALLSAAACTQDDPSKSNYDKKMDAVTEEIQTVKKHDKALLLVTFGSTWDAPQESFAGMKKEFMKKFSDMDVYFSFTSEICMTRCAAKGLNYYAPSFYLEALGLAGYKEICIQSLHVIPGEEFLRLKNEAKDFHNSGDHPEFANVTVYLGGPLLDTENDVQKVAAVIDSKYSKDVNNNKIVAFMGHGNPEGWNYGNGNSRYVMLEEVLQKISDNYYVGTVDMENNLIDNVIARMQKNGKKSGDVLCHPLMSIAGDHANNDMKGGVSENEPEEGSWRYEFGKAGYNCPLSNCTILGLADYPEIVKIWMSHTEKALQTPMFEE